MEGRAPRNALPYVPDSKIEEILMLRTELDLAVFLCAGGKNRVWSVSHRLGSFGRIGLFAGVLFHKKDQKRENPRLALRVDRKNTKSAKRTQTVGNAANGDFRFGAKKYRVDLTG